MMNKSLKLIGLTGFAGSGKDTVAKFLCDTQGFKSISLAEPIKLGIVAMFGIPMEYLETHTLKEQPLKILGNKTPRQVMQTLGTEWAREMVDDNIWINIAQHKIDVESRLAAANEMYLDGLVITDIRFKDEAKWLRNQGGEIWRILRPDNPCRITSEHCSEMLVPRVYINKVIVNDNNIDNLHERVAEIMSYKEPPGSYVGDCI